MSHYRDNGRTGCKIFRIILLLGDCLNYIGTYILGLEAIFFCHNVNGFCIKTLVDSYHHSQAHTSGDYIGDRYIHHVGQVVGRHKLGELQYAAFSFLLFEFFLMTLCAGFPFLPSVFGPTLFASLLGEAGKCFLNLLLYIFFTHLCLNRLPQRRLPLASGRLAYSTRFIDVYFGAANTRAFSLLAFVVSIGNSRLLFLLIDCLFLEYLYFFLLQPFAVDRLLFTFKPFFLTLRP